MLGNCRNSAVADKGQKKFGQRGGGGSIAGDLLHQNSFNWDSVSIIAVIFNIEISGICARCAMPKKEKGAENIFALAIQRLSIAGKLSAI